MADTDRTACTWCGASLRASSKMCIACGKAQVSAPEPEPEPEPEVVEVPPVERQVEPDVEIEVAAEESASDVEPVEGRAPREMLPGRDHMARIGADPAKPVQRSEPIQRPEPVKPAVPVQPAEPSAQAKPGTQTKPVAQPKAKAQPPKPKRPSVIDAVEKMALAAGRSDLADHVDGVRASIESAELRVLIAGEHKQGKSTLVNALCNAPISPIGAASATVVPISIRHGERFEASVSWADGSTDAIDGSLADVVLEHGAEAESGHVMVEVKVPRRLVAASVCLVDTPPTTGVDGIGSMVALELADSSDLMLFVSDATQELTEPELALLREARERRARLAVVMTRADLSPDPERLADINRMHLRAAGMAEVKVHVVSAHLHLAALGENDHLLEDLSGFGGLYELIANARRDVVELAAKAAGSELAAVVAQIELGSAVRHAPRQVEKPVLAETTRRLDPRTAPWRMDLTRGINRLKGHSADSRNRRRIAIVRSYKEALENESASAGADLDSKDFFEFLYREIHRSFAEHQEWLRDELSKLDAEIRRNFELTVDACVLDVLGDLPADASGTPMRVSGSRSVERPPMFAAMQGWTTAAVLTSPIGAGAVAGGLITGAMAPFVAAPIALVLGPRFVREARKRRQMGEAAALREQAVEIIAMSWQELEERERRVLEEVEDQLTEHYQRQGSVVVETLIHAGEATVKADGDKSAPPEGLTAALAAVRTSLGSDPRGVELMAI